MKESIVLLILGACWAGYLGWYWRENRRTSDRRRDGIRAFSSGLGTLGGSAARSGAFAPGLPPLAPRTASDAARRRREVLMGLSVAALVTFFAAIGIGGAIVVSIHLLIDAALIGYGYLLVQHRNAAAEREIKVTMLHPERSSATAAEPVRALGG
ncbi:MAG: hypothetical protein R8F63_02480 [Acidimicrobiales bacterium]|nr:hypothetical protein [Acidimicrobiales bacterium]